MFKKESSLVLRGYKYTSSVHFQTRVGVWGWIQGEHLTYRGLSLWGECKHPPDIDVSVFHSA